MIKTFKHPGLKELFETGATRRIEKNRWERCLDMLRNLNAARTLREIDLPGYKLHNLAPQRPATFTTRAYGPWRITFRFENGDAYDVDLEQYH